MDSGKLIGAIYLDLTKVFDPTGHNVLIDKLLKFGICGKSRDWFVEYLFNRSQTVEINGSRSVVEPIVSDFPQGSILRPLLFMFYNDFPNHIQSFEVIMYADDTVIFYANKDPTVIESKLNKDMENIKNYCFTNELIINTKKEKIKVMLFGTSKPLKLSGKKLEITFTGKQINFVSNYRYLSVIIDDTMTLNDNFNHTYEAASSRLQLLGKMKSFITVKARYAIYKSMIIPLLTYSCLIQSTFTKTQLDCFSSIDRRAKAKLPNESQTTNIHSYLKRECINMVMKCFKKEFTSDIFDNYFEMIDHSMNTRNNKHCIKQPPVKIEVARCGFYFTGSTLYNSLPIDITKTDSVNIFKKKVSEFFK